MDVTTRCGVLGALLPDDANDEVVRPPAQRATIFESGPGTDRFRILEASTLVLYPSDADRSFILDDNPRRTYLSCPSCNKAPSNRPVGPDSPPFRLHFP
jgi:hypothetical protein